MRTKGWYLHRRHHIFQSTLGKDQVHVYDDVSSEQFIREHEIIVSLSLSLISDHKNNVNWWSGCWLLINGRGWEVLSGIIISLIQNSTAVPQRKVIMSTVQNCYVYISLVITSSSYFLQIFASPFCIKLGPWFVLWLRLASIRLWEFSVVHLFVQLSSLISLSLLLWVDMNRANESGFRALRRRMEGRVFTEDSRHWSVHQFRCNIWGIITVGEWYLPYQIIGSFHTRGKYRDRPWILCSSGTGDPSCCAVF